jgi:hypothetical protein
MTRRIHRGLADGLAMALGLNLPTCGLSEAIYTNALSFDCLLAYGLPKTQN